MNIDGIKQLQLHVAEWRRRAGLTLRDLSKVAGVDHVTISRLENGRIKPPKNALKKLAAALRLTAEEKDKLEQWTNSLPAVKRLSGNTKGMESSLLIRALAILAEVQAEMIEHAWIEKPSATAYDTVVVLFDGRQIGIKINSDGSYKLGEASEDHDLPPVGTARPLHHRATPI